MSNYFLQNKNTNANNDQSEINFAQLFNSKKKQHSDSLNCIFNCGKYQLIITLKNKNQLNKNIALSSYSRNITPLFFYDITSDELLSQICNENYSKKMFPNANKMKIKDESQIFPEYDFNQKCNILIFSHVKFPLNINQVQFNNQNSKNSCVLFIVDNKKYGDYIFTMTDLKNSNEINLKFSGTIHNQNFIKKDIEITLTSNIIINSLNEYLKINKKTYFSNDSFFLVKINFKKYGFYYNINSLAILFAINEIMNNEKFYSINYEPTISDNILIKKIFIGIDIPKYSNSLYDTIKNSLNSSTEISNTCSDEEKLCNIQNNINLYSNKMNNIDNINSFNETDEINILPTSSDKLSLTDNEKQNTFFYDENNECFRSYSSINNNNFDVSNNKKNEEVKVNFINKSDDFNLAIFNKYKKNKYVCNFLIFKENIDINKIYIEKIFRNNFNLNTFLKIFKGEGIFPLMLPLINCKGHKEIRHFNPSLSSLVLYLENENIFNYFKKFFGNSDFYIPNELKELIIKKFSDKIIKIEYYEKNYPSEREVLDTRITQLINIFEEIDVSIEDIIIDKSFLSILWNPSNDYKIQTSFLSFYSFDLNLIGILAIKLDENKWFDCFTEKKEIEINYCYKEFNFRLPSFKNDYYSGVDNVKNLLDKIEKYEQENEKIKSNPKILNWRYNFKDYMYYIKNSI